MKSVISKIRLVLRLLKKHKTPFLFISPFFILFGIFMIYPLLYSFILGFHQWSGGGEKIFVGLRNYIKLIRDPTFLKTLLNAVIYFVGYVPIMTFLAIILAVILNSAYVKFRSIFRTIIYIPNVVSLVVLGLVFQFMLSQHFGIANLILTNLGIGKVPWLSDPTWARISVCIMMIWRWLGVNMIYMLAGLQAIPLELYEAAEIDGAGALGKFFRITIPLLQPVIVFALILSTIGTFQMFAEVYTLTGGGPMKSTLTPVYYLYNNAFQWTKFGYASSIAYILFVITGVLSFIQFKISEKTYYT